MQLGMLTRLEGLDFFSILGKEFLDFRDFLETDATARHQAYWERVTGRSALDISVNRLLLHDGPGPHTRRTDADVGKQRTVAYLSGRGQREHMFLPP